MSVEDVGGVWMAADDLDVLDFAPTRLFLEKHRVPVADKGLAFCERKRDFAWISASSLT